MRSRNKQLLVSNQISECHKYPLYTGRPHATKLPCRVGRCGRVTIHHLAIFVCACYSLQSHLLKFICAIKLFLISSLHLRFNWWKHRSNGLPVHTYMHIQIYIAPIIVRTNMRRWNLRRIRTQNFTKKWIKIQPTSLNSLITARRVVTYYS